MLPDISLVAKKLNLVIKHENESEVICNCPVCGEQKGHMCIDKQKNVWHCPRCDAGGGVYGLIEQTYNISHAEALQLVRHMNFEDLPKRIVHEKTSAAECELAPLKTRDQTYRAMLDLLYLKQCHRNDLKRRGLSEAAIKSLSFKSTMDKNNSEIPGMLISSGNILAGVPGFFKKYGKWRMYCPISGYFIPYIENGLIAGLQIRNDNPDSKRRYRWFTSARFPFGTKMQNCIHEISFPSCPDAVCLTEGALKADVASYLHYKLTGKKLGFVAVPGVNSTKAFKTELKRLKQLGVTEIIEAFDMDKAGNYSVPVKPEVESARQKIRNLILAYGFEYQSATWSAGKGIDDFLLEKMLKRRLAS